jgi:tRNA(Ile2) C34 agmatinyltransferase TiaS
MYHVPGKLDVIKGVRRLLDNPRSWVQGVSALDSRDGACSGWSTEAVSWCLGGALNKVGLELIGCGRAGPFVNWHIRNTRGTALVAFNDAPHRRHEDILALLDELIKEYDKVLGEYNEQTTR